MKNKTLIVVARQYSRNKLYTIISLISIAMAIAITLLVYSFVVKEIKTDHFHKNGREIFRRLSRQTPSDPYQAHHFGVFGPNFFQHASDIQSYVRTWEIPSNMKSDPEQTTAYPVSAIYPVKKEKCGNIWSTIKSTYSMIMNSCTAKKIRSYF